MGLAERRAVKAFQDDRFEGLKGKLDEAAGFTLDVEVDWGSLAVDDYAHLYDEAFPKVFFEPLREAFANICQDDMGKEALKESLKKVVIKNSDAYHSAPSCFAFKDGVLTFDHKPITNIDYGKERADNLVKHLEKAL